jgi:hypothetical protein
MADIGRPTVMTAETIAKLEQAFVAGATDSQACFIAGIGDRTLYDYCEVNPDFAQRKETLKSMVKYKARANVTKAILEGDIETSQWFLEKRDAEFKPKSKVEVDTTIAIELNINDSQYRQLVRLAAERLAREARGETVV